VKRKDKDTMIPKHPLRDIRRAGVPLAVFETADPAQTVVNAIKFGLNGKAEKTLLMEWDLIRGLRGINEPGQSMAAEIGDPVATLNPAECLGLIANKAPDDAVIFFHGAHMVIANESVRQGIWNLRDIFKSCRSTLILLCPGISLPQELKQDVVVISEPLPDAGEVKGIAQKILEAAKEKGAAIDSTVPEENVIDSMLGLSAFAAEQVLAMSVNKEGIDKKGLWERKRKMIEQTPGLAVWRGGETFADIGGCDNVKTFLKRILGGKAAPRSIGFIDEIEKALGGARGDTSGVSTDQLMCLLTFMQDKGIPGMIFIGPGGSGKSAIGKSAGNEGNIPTISIDLGGMKGSLVGESEQRLRAALKVFQAVSQGSGLFIATCNSIGSLPPELRRRFTLGTFFFDLPSAEERRKIWEIYLKRYSIEGKPEREANSFEGWTGAEIKACCDVAWRTGLSITEASRFIVPVSKSAGDQIEALRKQASGRFISASNPGMYELKQEVKTGRKMEI